MRLGEIGMDSAAFEASLEAAAARAGDLTPLVYDRLFARHPGLKAEFWRDSRGAIQGEMLARVFETLIDLAGPRVMADHYITTEITTHDAYGIARGHFTEFFAIVGETVAAAAGPDWTPAMAAAWGEALREIDAVLAAMPGPDGSQPGLEAATILADR